jgi:hypothetical protein
MYCCVQILHLRVETAVLVEMLALLAVRAVARGPIVVEDEMRRDSCRSRLLCGVVRYYIAQYARVEPQAVEQGWGAQSFVHSAYAAAEMLDGDLVAPVSYRSSSQSI